MKCHSDITWSSADRADAIPFRPALVRQGIALLLMVSLLSGCAGIRPEGQVDAAGAPVTPDMRVAIVPESGDHGDGVADLVIQFGFESTEITPDTRAQITALALVASTAADSVIQVDAHTDNRGWSLGNLELSRLRALSVARLLVDEGVPGDRLQLRAHGESQPIARNSSFEGRARNRRVTVHVR